MGSPRRLFPSFIAVLAALAAATALAAGYPEPKAGDWVTHDFRFHTGEVMKDVRLHYVTVGDPKGEPVLVLHGTSGSSASMLTPHFAGELFGPGQPLDASRYYLIVTDALGTGKSTRPSDGLRAKFPQYDYDDMVRAQYLLRDRGARRQASSPHHRQLHGRHAGLDVGRDVSRLHGRDRADGLPAHRDVGPQLDAAAHVHGVDPP